MLPFLLFPLFPFFATSGHNASYSLCYHCNVDQSSYALSNGLQKGGDEEDEEFSSEIEIDPFGQLVRMKVGKSEEEKKKQNLYPSQTDIPGRSITESEAAEIDKTIDLAT